MANPMEYIVFEPDQVLTNDHLNETFNYLDQQNRWTRNKLIGIGIVCGFEIVLNTGVIEVTKGCGVTSQGYLITQNTSRYTYFLPYAAIDVPNDLPFIYDKGDLPFYKPFCTGRKVWQLLTDDEFNALENAQKLKAKTLSSAAANLSNYAVVLFLEARETDLKNCDTQDCNNKGEKMAFKVKPLLVAKNDLPDIAKITGTPLPGTDVKINLPAQIPLKRFNVPYTDLNNTDDVLNAFIKLVDDATLSQVVDAYANTWQKYSAILKVTSNPFITMLNDLKKYRELVLKQNPVFIEYFYDFVDDLIKAYDEFTAKISSIISTCCPDENLFPLHLILGDASLSSNAYVKDSYRNRFIYSPLFSKMSTESAEVILLFTRMVQMVKNFSIQSQELSRKTAIRITPSFYQRAWLSERAIPYYYNLNVTGAELYKSWSYYKTNRGNATLNLSYNAGLYTNNATIVKPLLYDIEPYSFFRVEGHIGQNYQTALSDILNQRLSYNLPFDVVAISAEQLSGTATLPDCNIRDLETDYNLILSEAMCKIHVTFCFVTKLPYTPQTSPTTPGVFTNVPKEETIKFSEFKLAAARGAEMSMVLNTAYKKGDFLRKYCPALPNTIGSGYLSSLNNAGVFDNPVSIDQNNPLSALYYYFFQFVNTVEELMFALNTHNISNIDMDDFGLKYQNYLRDTTLAINALIILTVKNVGPKDSTTVTFIEDYEIDLLVEAFGVLTSICIDERLQVLKDEYTSRLTQYKQQLTFLNYYKNHPGLEHKAGVPKGGTLVLVYKNVPVTTRVPGRLTDIADTVIRDRQSPVFRAQALMSEQPATKSSSFAEKAEMASFTNLDENTINRFKKVITDSKEISEIDRRSLLDILAGRGALASKFPVTNGVVIADFYIPYLCCSDCPPVAYIMPEKETPPPVQEKPVIKMGDTFCDNDANQEKIEVSIPNGTFNTVPGLDQKNQTFTPATAGKGQYSIIYTVNGVSSDPFIVTVLPTPGSEFLFDSGINADGVITAKFIPKDQDASFVYKWTFDPSWEVRDLSTLGIATVMLKFNRTEGEKEVKVILVVSNGNCHQTEVTKILHVSANGLFEPSIQIKREANVEKLITRKKKK